MQEGYYVYKTRASNDQRSLQKSQAWEPIMKYEELMGSGTRWFGMGWWKAREKGWKKGGGQNGYDESGKLRWSMTLKNPPSETTFNLRYLLSIGDAVPGNLFEFVSIQEKQAN